MSWLNPQLSQLLETSDSGVWGNEDLDNGISVLRSTNIKNDGSVSFENLSFRDIPKKKREEKLLHEGDIILENSGGGPKQPVGRVSYFAGDVRDHVVGNFCRRLRPNNDVVNPRFLFWRLFHGHLIGDTLRFQTQTTGLRNLQFKNYAEQPIWLPPLSEQHRIVELLDQAAAMRRLRREADAKAARILPTLFLKMFGDPATNPMGWPTERLDNLFAIRGGGTPSTAISEYWKGDIPWVSPKDMKIDVITDTEDHITEQAIANSTTTLIAKGSVLIVYRSGILAHTFPVAIAGRDVALNQDLKALNATGAASNEYIYGLFLTAQKLALSFVKKGATVHNIDGARFLAMQVPIPPQALQERFISHLDSLMTLKRRYASSADGLDETFQLLMQKAFSGEMTAKWRKAHMQELLVEMQQQAKALNLPVPQGIS